MKSNKNYSRCKKIRKTIMLGCMCALLSTGIPVEAKTLANSFSGGSTYTCTGSKRVGLTTYLTYKKTTYSQTKGYSGRHYVRAYIGGSSSSASGAVADSGRKWSSGDVKATANYSVSYLTYLNKFAFPTGYAKYGK